MTSYDSSAAKSPSINTNLKAHLKVELLHKLIGTECIELVHMLLVASLTYIVQCTAYDVDIFVRHVACNIDDSRIWDDDTTCDSTGRKFQNKLNSYYFPWRTDILSKRKLGNSLAFNKETESVVYIRKRRTSHSYLDVRFVWTLFENGTRKIMPTRMNFSGVRVRCDVKAEENPLRKTAQPYLSKHFVIAPKQFNAIEIHSLDGCLMTQIKQQWTLSNGQLVFVRMFGWIAINWWWIFCSFYSHFIHFVSQLCCMWNILWPMVTNYAMTKC